LRVSALGFLLVGILMAAFLWVVRRHRTRLTNLIAQKTRRLPLLARQAWRLGAFADGIRFPEQHSTRVWFLGYTCSIWAVSAVQIEFLLNAFNLTLSWGCSWLMLVALAVGVSLPSAPGLIGTFHYSLILVLIGYGVGQTEAATYAVVFHAVTVVPLIVWGLALVWQRGLSLSGLIGVGQKS
jgi:glycosyltransferase 2 family protein